MDDVIRDHIASTLARAEDDDMVVMAIVSPDGVSAVSHVANPRPVALGDLASSLLSHALDLLRAAGSGDSELAREIEVALGALSDRFGERYAKAVPDA